MSQRVANANLLTQDEFGRLGEVFWTDVDALVKQRNLCWSLANNSGDWCPAGFLIWLDHARTVQVALDCWSGGQL